ncbi:hypothetical protein EV699_11244 [Plasticicumulans lactativorans]|uniref:ATP nucleosidase Cap17-like N-terminal domain-containing protein n=1 Tax=Plasticicumulans lactativorans TaxID=1133106 RepID=A0A4R2L8Z7_9GAMM|nr:hypothetical protein [Plasticicumulans lactativorans]TCO80709.1 hypothetical protein EV699_11244 [Plasticicumulans lactativorans]
MPRSALFGRRIHITGSIVEDANVATAAEVTRAREFVKVLVLNLLSKGANFVIPVDAEKTRGDGQPICFDWLVWETVHSNLSRRPADAPGPLVIAIKHHKNEGQIPAEHRSVWDAMRVSPLVQIESAAHWNMASKRMELQAQHGDILIAVGGGEGVLFLANLYHDAGKPLIPLNFTLGPATTGASRIFDFGMSGSNAQRLFQTEGAATSQSWLNRIEMYTGKTATDGVGDVLDLLEDLVSPKAFVVRLLNPTHADYNDVQSFFDNVVQPVMEGELGYKLTVVDGNQSYEHARIDDEIFKKLHRSSVVIADITGARPNCFIELGYALGRALPTMLTAKAGTEHPFDIYSLSGHRWNTTGSAAERRDEFRKHWNAIKNRPPIVPADPLIP